MSIPDLPGVPHIPRSPNAPVVIQAALGLIEGAIWNIINSSPIWGVFDQAGNIVLQPDSVVAFSFRNESKLASFPVQDGAFATYNKVATPFDTIVRMTVGRTENDRALFLATVGSISRDTNLYSVVTPEVVYVNVNLAGYDYQRTSNNGAYMITVDLRFTEIRQASPQYTTISQVTVNAKPSSAVPPAAQGRVQAAPPSVSVLKQITNGIGSILQ